MPFVDFAELINFDLLEEKDLVKCIKHNAKKINHNYIVVNKSLQLDILDRSKVLQHFDNVF